MAKSVENLISKCEICTFVDVHPNVAILQIIEKYFFIVVENTFSIAYSSHERIKGSL